ncbi:MAG: glycosyltransferase [Melioribacteraceae bacterium]|nr:glycosyltransferase [Melioribacteraceae bacterium]
MKIAAVVVTYNRLELLKKCIDALRNQSYQLDRIIIIDNSSGDGTWKYLLSLDFVDSVRQQNSGGAGGFCAGIKKAYSEGFDLVWCMDDDNEPEYNSLKYLLERVDSDERIFNSLCIEKITNDPCFGLYINGKLSLDINEISKNEIIKSANFFNGTLIPREVIKRIGFPNPHYWEQGDNFDYFLEAIEKGISSITITKSIIYHPKQNYKLIKFFGKDYKYAIMSSFKKRIFIRNILFIYKTRSSFTLRNMFRIIVFECIGIFKYQPGSVLSFLSGIVIGLFTTKKIILLNKEYPLI